MRVSVEYGLDQYGNEIYRVRGSIAVWDAYRETFHFRTATIAVRRTREAAERLALELFAGNYSLVQRSINGASRVVRNKK